MSGQFFIALSRLTQAKPFQFLVFSLFQFCDMASDALWTLESPGPYIMKMKSNQIYMSIFRNVLQEIKTGIYIYLPFEYCFSGNIILGTDK